jgi:hypothetical protein
MTKIGKEHFGQFQTEVHLMGALTLSRQDNLVSK